MRRLFLAAVVTVACTNAGGEADSAASPSRTDSVSAPNQGNPVTMSDSVRVTTDKQSYRPGETVKLTIASSATARFTYNPCTRIVERETASGWTAVREERICTMVAHLLEPRQTNDEQTEMAEGIEPGRYRLVLQFTDDTPGVSRSVRAATAPLTVVR